jgi:endonuclease/exonuclease/phosphatase family metal-dependent hydrolase
VGLLTREGYTIESVRSHVDDPDPDTSPARRGRPLFSRDCPEYSVTTPTGGTLLVLVNHLKSQSWTSGDPDPLRRRQAERVRAIVDERLAAGVGHLAVIGDLNRHPAHESLAPLVGPGAPLVDAFGLDVFDDGGRPGTFQACGETQRLDYLLLSPALAAAVTAGGVFRKGLWGNPKNKSRPKAWACYDEIDTGARSASDHAAVWVDVTL